MDRSSNYFELFGLAVGYQIDREQLADRYRELQRHYHPDRYASHSEQERRLALQRSSLLNEANRVLLDPVARARYLLELSGVEWPLESQTIRDPEFLMEQMELREELEQSREAADPITALEQFAERMGQRLQRHGERFSAALNSDPGAGLTIARQMQFFDRLQRQALDQIDGLL